MLPSGWADPVTGQWGRPPANGDARVARSQSRVHAVHDQMCVDSEGGGGRARVGPIEGAADGGQRPVGDGDGGGVC